MSTAKWKLVHKQIYIEVEITIWTYSVVDYTELLGIQSQIKKTLK